MTHKLELSTPSALEICLTRTFNAPRRLVFELSKPELVQRWLLGPPGWTMIVCEIDFRVGGKYRYVWRHEDGTEMGMGGEYLEITPPDRTVHTERFDQAWYAGGAVITTALTESGGQTKFVGTIRYDSPEARDGVLKSGMEAGVAASYDRLEELLASGTA